MMFNSPLQHPEEIRYLNLGGRKTPRIENNRDRADEMVEGMVCK